MNKIKEALQLQPESDLNQVLQLLKDGETWELDAFSTNQALRKIIENEMFEIIDILIENETISLDIFEYHNFTNTIFELFIETPFTEKNREYLLKIIKDIENIDAEISQKTWLGFAIESNANIEFLEILIHNGCNINTIDSIEQTYLFYTKNIELTEFLIHQGLDINKKNLAGQTVLYNGVKKENIRRTRNENPEDNRTKLIQLYLDNGIDVNSQDKKGNTVYEIVCFEIVNSDIFEQLSNYDPPRLDLKNNKGRSLFFEFISIPVLNVAMLEQMLKLRPDVYQGEKNPYGVTVTAADILAKKPASIIELLLKYNLLDVEKVDNKGNSWLHKVCMEELNYEQIKATELYKKVKILLKAGADPNLKNDEDKSPIDYAQNDNLKAKALTILLKN
ncbi:MAG: hypothetical protein L3J23_00900 [Flavobacteriaceae bacterium]|nr:hypothetical protein [Flavobacteriaceae bacterium]